MVNSVNFYQLACLKLSDLYLHCSAKRIYRGSYMSPHVLLNLLNELSNFWHKNVIILSLCMQRCYRGHNISHKSVNPYWFIDFIAWRYFTPRCDFI